MRLCENKEAQYEMQVKVGTCCSAPRPLSLFEFWHDHEEFYHVSASMIFDKEEVQEPYKNLVLPYTTKQTAALLVRPKSIPLENHKREHTSRVKTELPRLALNSQFSTLKGSSSQTPVQQNMFYWTINLLIFAEG